jgi:hypothetical protein
MTVWQFDHPNADPKACPKPPMGLTHDVHLKYFFAKTFGWTPDMVDELSLDEFHWFPLIETARNDASEHINNRER